MESNLQHEDLLIKIRSKLNEEKIKLWEPPYTSEDDNVSPSLQDLAKKYSDLLRLDYNVVLNGLQELQSHSIERSKANEEFKETGCATLRIKVTATGQKMRNFKIMKKLSVLGDDLNESIASELDIDKTRVKLIHNGKVIKSNLSLEEQGVRNGVQMMALVMAEAPEKVKKEDNMYMEMKATVDDATLLSEYVDELAEDEEYMKLEDQSGKTVELPAAEKRSLLVGLALHERGRSAAIAHDYSLALVLFLEADRQFSECRSSILSTVDNWAVLQLDIAWCYLCLQNLSSAADAASRLARAETAFRASYGEDHQRLIALKGTAANERVLFMRLYLLQGIVAYHQNKRDEAKALLEKAEVELNSLRVNDEAVEALVQLGWSAGQARWGLRAAGDPDSAHRALLRERRRRTRARERGRRDREQRALGCCVDGSAVNSAALAALTEMGFERRLAVLALRNANNDVTDAIRLIHDHPDMLIDSDLSEDSDSSSAESIVEPDNKLIAELEAMGYETEEAQKALRLSKNKINEAVDLLAAGQGKVLENNPNNPSTSAATASRKNKKKEERDKKKQREMALRRLKKSITTEDDDYVSASLSEEEQYLVQYKSLL